METKKQEHKCRVFFYEFIGCMFIMYSMMVTLGELNAPIYLAFMLMAWNVSGGHFNPAITFGVFLSEKKCDNFCVMFSMMLG